MIFETHAHFDDKAFDADRKGILSTLRENGIEYLINVAADLKSVDTTFELTQTYGNVYGALGVHPSEVEELTDESIAYISKLCQNEKVVAVGEIGLDYHWPEPGKDVQKEWFVRQLEMAKEVNLPVVIHSRDAAKDTIDIMQSDAARGLSAVIHCYSYTLETAKIFLKQDYYFGIGGVVTFSNAKKLVEAVEYIPMERILLETDCPYLAPTPHRGERNSSLYLPLVAKKIAEIKNISYEDVIEITNQNAKRLFTKVR